MKSASLLSIATCALLSATTQASMLAGSLAPGNLRDLDLVDKHSMDVDIEYKTTKKGHFFLKDVDTETIIGAEFVAGRFVLAAYPETVARQFPADHFFCKFRTERDEDGQKICLDAKEPTHGDSHGREVKLYLYYDKNEDASAPGLAEHTTDTWTLTANSVAENEFTHLHIVTKEGNVEYYLDVVDLANTKEALGASGTKVAPSSTAEECKTRYAIEMKHLNLNDEPAGPIQILITPTPAGDNEPHLHLGGVHDEASDTRTHAHDAHDALKDKQHDEQHDAQHLSDTGKAKGKGVDLDSAHKPPVNGEKLVD